MKATKKIVGAACALVAAVALSAGSTFAWFTSNSNVNVTSIDAKVVTYGGDLQIGLVTYGTSEALAPNGESETGTVKNYSSSVDGNVIKGKLGASFKLDAVTSADGKIMKDVANATATPNGENGIYIQFTVSLRSTTAMKIYLAKESSVTSTDSTNGTTIKCWGDVTANTYGKNQSTAWTAESGITAKAQAASRVSFETTGEGGKTSVWAPWESSTNGGKLKETEIEALDDCSGYGYYKGVLASDYAEATGKDTLKFSAQPTYANKIYPAAGKVVAEGEATGEVNEIDAQGSLVCTLAAGVAKTVTIRMWIEGKDGDCFNSIFDQTVAMALSFCGVDVKEPPVESGV